MAQVDLKVGVFGVSFCQQGSSENGGRSDVYDRSELKVISNCCYTNCCCTNCGLLVNLGKLPEFTRIYLNLLEFI